MKSTNIGIIADTHEPFAHRKYLDFCVQTFKEWKCTEYIHIGDLVDNHAISASWDADPDGFSPFNEHREALIRLRKWYKAFPSCTVLIGNHDERIERAAMKYGLSSAYFRDFKELWEFPKKSHSKWDYVFDTFRYGVRFFSWYGVWWQARAC